MFFHPVDEGSISLAVVGRRAVQVGDFVDGVGGKVGRSSLALGEVSFSSGGRVCHFALMSCSPRIFPRVWRGRDMV